MTELATKCCAELKRGFMALRLENQSCMPTVKDGGPTWMRALVCALNVFLTPWCLGFHLARIYVLPCIYYSVCRADLLALCYPRCLGLYEDTEFPADDSSLGDLGTKKGDIEWKRLTAKDGEVPKMKLFEGAIEAQDVCQGALGDCWLMSAFACMAEVPGAIQSLFYSHRFNPRGKYFIQIYDAQASRWTRVSVDNRFPFRNGKPLFSQPHGDEEWVLLLEKAFAKFCEGPRRLQNGSRRRLGYASTPGL